ncbi:MAG: DsrE family protein [Bacteroidota bacterium]
MLFCLFLLVSVTGLWGQQKVNPMVPSFGGIYALPEATVKPDPKLRYRIIVDVVTGAPEPTELAAGLNNVARMLNLHTVGGVPADSMEVVLAIHGGATFAVLRNELFRKEFGVDNPNIPLIQELRAAGVKLVVCGQSLIGRSLATTAPVPEVEVATSMLTTVSMYQLRGFAVFRF